MSKNSIEETSSTATEKNDILGAVLVATNRAGTLHYAKAFGTTGVSPDAKSLTLDATFWLASCSTIACLQCVERGLFSLDSSDDVANLLPEIAAPDIFSDVDSEGRSILTPAKNRITLRQLLTRTAGMSYEFLDPRLVAWRKTPEGSRTFSDEFTATCLFPLLYEPGEQWSYSVSMDWAGKMVERASNGLALEAYMQMHIWNPLGIQDITFCVEQNELVKQQLVETTARVPDSALLIQGENEVVPDLTGYDSGGGGLFGSAPGYLRVLTSILREDGKLLQKEMIAEMFKPQLSPRTKDSWMEMYRNPYTHACCGGLPDIDVTWGLGGQYSLEDMDGRRKKGSLSFSGLPNLYWWIDPEAGIAGFYASRLVPTGDSQSTVLFAEFERNVYRQALALQ